MTWLVGLLSFLAGVAICLVISHWHQITLSYTLGISDVFNWLVVLALAKLLLLYWQRRHSDVRVEKDLLIQQIKDAMAELTSARSIFIRCYDAQEVLANDARVIKWKLRNLFNTIHFLESGLLRCDRIKQISIADLKETLFSYKDAVTGGNFPAEPYSASDWREEESVYRVLHEGLQDLIFKINRA